jgi:hypothetical protein
MHKIVEINNLESLNTSYHGLKLKTVLKELLRLRTLTRRAEIKQFPKIGYYKIIEQKEALTAANLQIFNLIPQLELVTWKPKGDLDCAEMPNEVLLEIHFKKFIIKLGY